MLFGHVAVSLLEHRYLNADLVPVLVAGVFPDVMDKTLCQVLHLTPSGRMFGHTLVGLALSAAVVRLIWGRQAGWSWGLGYLAHLLGDMGGFVPWLYPFLAYGFPQHPPGLLEILRQALDNAVIISLDLVFSAWAISALCWSRGKNDAWRIQPRSGAGAIATTHILRITRHPERRSEGSAGRAGEAQQAFKRLADNRG